MTAALTKILPWLNQAIPIGSAIKGLGKVNPKLSDFIYQSIGAGYGAEQILDFIRDKVEPSGQRREESRLASKEAQGALRPDEKLSADRMRDTQKLRSAASTGLGIAAGAMGLPSSISPSGPAEGETESVNVIMQESPDLHEFISAQLQQGRSLDEAGALAQNNKDFASVINRLMKKTNRRWSDILAEVYGGQGQRQSPLSQEPQRAAQQQQGSGADEALLQAMRDLQNVLGG